jgi:glycosyltransferase involved in cell wall biosynthesis
MMVTILLPIYNDEKYINFSVQSILSQTYQNYNCIIGFNGTIDSSKEIVTSLVGNNEKFTILDYGEESGKALTLNKMLKFVKTEFICLIDGDDIWKNDKLETQINYINEYPTTDVIGTFATYINENNLQFFNLDLVTEDYNIRNHILNGNNQVVNSSCFVRTECANEINGWDSSIEGLEDYDFWVKLAKREKKFYNIPQYLVYHRVHQNSNFNSRNLPHTPSDILIKNNIHVN